MTMSMRSRGIPYTEKIVGMFRSNIVGYWPLHETAGATAYDHGPNGFNGTYGNVSLANLADHHGDLAPLFNGNNSEVSLPDISSKFSGDEGTLSLWVRFAAGFFADANNHAQFYLSVDANNKITMNVNSADHTLRMLNINGGTWDGGGLVYDSEEVWTNFVHTWSKAGGSCKLYLNGSLQYTDATFLGAFAGVPAVRSIGSYGAYWAHSGHICDVLLLNKIATAGDVQNISHAGNFGVIGDSISAPYSVPYWAQIVSCEAAEPYLLINHSVGGNSIMASLESQVSSTVADYAKLMVVALGANDDDEGDMDVLKQEVIDQLYRLRLLNTNARIYYLNVLPCWDDAVAGPEKPKDNIRAAIADACAESDNVICWDTHTDPWILQSDTSDGVHPTAAGLRKIADRVLALI
ncbi:MAG: hypothetical protein FIA98_04680 [Anaerolineae bacterium]|nr:hypothetical protein [Anaerolineae bacterium]